MACSQIQEHLWSPSSLGPLDKKKLMQHRACSLRHIRSQKEHICYNFCVVRKAVKVPRAWLPECSLLNPLENQNGYGI